MHSDSEQIQNRMKQDLQSLPLEELLKKEKTLKFITGILTGFAIVLYGVAIFFTIKGGMKVTTLMVCALAISALLPKQYQSIKSLRAEINRR